MKINSEYLGINISDILLYFILSSYFCFTSFMSILTYNFELIIVFFCVTVGIIIFIYEENKKRHGHLFTPSMFIIIAFFIVAIITFVTYLFTGYFLISKIGLSIISILISVVYAIDSLQRMYFFNMNKNNFMKTYKVLLNINTFKPSYTKILILYTIYYIFVYSILCYAIFEFMHHRYFFPLSFDSINLVFIFICFCSILYSVYYLIIGKYEYVFKLCLLSEHKEIPLTILTDYFDNNIDISKKNIQNWFDNNIGLYMNNVIVDTDKQVVLFSDCISNSVDNTNDDIDYNETNVDDNIYILDGSIKIIDDLLVMVVSKGTHLTKTLYDIKTSLKKIEYLHTDNKAYSRHIDNINKKYIPYVEYLVKTYLKNIDLTDDDVKELQEKIVLSLQSISDALDQIYESKFDVFKFNVENNIDVMDILLKQDGLIDNVKKNK